MATKDLFSQIKPQVALNFGTINSDTTTEGNIIDTQGFESVTVGIITGTLTDGDYTLQLKDSADGTTFAVVTDANLIGTEAAASFTADADDNKISKLGYRGIKRYVRAEIVSALTTSGAVIGAYCILGDVKSGADTTQTR
jgi:nicotinic acid phosphoribosyltransferase